MPKNLKIGHYRIEEVNAPEGYTINKNYVEIAVAVSYTHLYLADDNGSQEVEVTRTRDVDVLNVTLNSGNLMSICQDRLEMCIRDRNGW